MSGILRPPLNKIPGGDMPLAEKENHLKDLTRMTRVDLLEIKDREGKLLANKAKLQRLPDKGKRIQILYDKVVAELERRSNVDEAAAMFSELNIATKGERALNELEWCGRLQNDDADPTADVIDSDDELEMDPLRIIAQRQMHERHVKEQVPEIQLITAEDLAEIRSFEADSTDSGVTVNNESTEPPAVDAEVVAIDVSEKLETLKPKLHTIITPKKHNAAPGDSRSSTPNSSVPEAEPHVQYLVEKTELNVQLQRPKFKPYQTTVSNVHDPAKERTRKKGKHWEVTAATPPPIQHDGTQLLSLMDSVELQTQYLAKLKQLQEKQAAERLAARLQRMEQRRIQLPSSEILKTKAAFTTYRTLTQGSSANQIEGDQRFNHEDDEVHDPLDEDKPGGVVNYTVYEHQL